MVCEEWFSLVNKNDLKCIKNKKRVNWGVGYHGEQYVKCLTNFKVIQKTSDNKYIARLKLDNDIFKLGTYETEAEAMTKYNYILIQMFGPYVDRSLIDDL